jgi:hypothetical protein
LIVSSNTRTPGTADTQRAGRAPVLQAVAEAYH